MFIVKTSILFYRPKIQIFISFFKVHNRVHRTGYVHTEYVFIYLFTKTNEFNGDPITLLHNTRILCRLFLAALLSALFPGLHLLLLLLCVLTPLCCRSSSVWCRFFGVACHSGSFFLEKPREQSD